MSEPSIGEAAIGAAPAQPVMPITVRVREACRLTGIGRSKMYMLIQEGHIEVIKVGSMTLITMRSLTAFLLPPPRP